MITKSTRTAVTPYRTKDGSLIRELMHPDTHANRQQSLAEAIVQPGTATALHRHHLSEELYHVISGRGIMTLGDADFPITQGDTICIPPGTAHRVCNDEAAPLCILCCCAPPYSHADTELLAE